MRWRLHYISSENDVREALKNPVIFAFWHNQQLLMLFTYKRYFRKLEKKSRRIVSLSSRHRDGRLIANTVKYFGIYNIAGSSTRGHVASLRSMVRGLAEGYHLSITPDGPTGPIYKAKKGLVEVAKQSGNLIIPIGLAASPAWYFKSWDKMFLGKPFSRVQAVFGKPISVHAYIEQGLSEEEITVLVNEALSEVMNIAIKNIADTKVSDV